MNWIAGQPDKRIKRWIAENRMTQPRIDITTLSIVNGFRNWRRWIQHRTLILGKLFNPVDFSQPGRAGDPSFAGRRSARTARLGLRRTASRPTRLRALPRISPVAGGLP